MGKYIFKRFLMLIPVIIGVSLMIFVMLDLAPGNVLDIIANDYTPEQLAELPEIVRVRDVDRDLVREEIDVEIPRDGHVDDLPADEVGLRFLGPGKFIDSQIDFKTHFADRPNNSTVGKRKGIKSSRKNSFYHKKKILRLTKRNKRCIMCV